MLRDRGKSIKNYTKIGNLHFSNFPHFAALIPRPKGRGIRAAIVYWSTWNNCVIKWKEKDVPNEWRGFAQRASGISGKGYKATHPVNAILNYAYAILAGQVERALQIAGFDVAVGSLHADQDGRASLVYDLMEPLRSVVDQIIFDWIILQRWRKADLVIDRQGVIRVHPQLGRVV